MIKLNNYEVVKKTMRECFYKLKDKNVGFRSRPSILCYKLLLELAQNLEQIHTPDLLLRAMDFNGASFITAIKFKKMAEILSTTPISLSRVFQKHLKNSWHILFKIYVPLSKPALATVALWSMVGHWNAWFDALIYISDDKKQVLQIFLQRIVIESNTTLMEMGITGATVADFTPATIKAATVIITILPIICVYPFLQKYFAKGIMLGGIKE